ncbi:MAG TPA: molybdate ABC transporter substrate-binding protein [Acidimicrobiales bacterium]
MTPVTRRALGTAALAVGLLVAGCGGSEKAPATAPPLSGTVTVLAASSLSESFTALGHRFEADHPGLTVTFNFGASSSLARQLIDGAPGDVLATADEITLGQALSADAVGAPAVFARNRLAIVTRPGNPEAIRGLADLARPGLVVVLCAREVPCGRFAVEALAKAGVTVEAASLEENVKAVLAKVTLGEADAGIVYVTDVAAARDEIAGVTIADGQNVVAAYPVAVATDAANPAGARAWVDFVLGPTGQAILSSFGFAPAGP